MANVIKSQDIYENKVTAEKRKINGHLGTTSETALFMANYAFTDELISQKKNFSIRSRGWCWYIIVSNLPINSSIR